MSTQVVVVIGAGSMGTMIARRVAQGRIVLLADLRQETLEEVSAQLVGEGYDVETHQVDTSDHASVTALASRADSLGEVVAVIHTAGVSPNLGTAQQVCAVDLAGTAFVLEELGKVVADGGSGLVISSQAAYMGPRLSEDLERALRTTASDELMDLEAVRRVEDSSEAYILAKRANILRVQAESVSWAARGARLNSVSPGIICTPLARQEMDGPNRAAYEAMIATSAAGRMGTPTEVAELAALLMGPNGRFFSGADILMDGGVIASMAASGDAQHVSQD